MTGFLAFLHQAGAWLAGQARTAWDVLAAVTSNHSAPARQVAVYTLVVLALVFVAPKALKKIGK